MVSGVLFIGMFVSSVICLCWGGWRRCALGAPQHLDRIL